MFSLINQRNYFLKLFLICSKYNTRDYYFHDLGNAFFSSYEKDFSNKRFPFSLSMQLVDIRQSRYRCLLIFKFSIDVLLTRLQTHTRTSVSMDAKTCQSLCRESHIQTSCTYAKKYNFPDNFPKKRQ